MPAGKFPFAGAPVIQVTKSNFALSIQKLKSHINSSDFISISTRQTGNSSILPIDTSETSYFKSKLAAETFELLQFTVCPFSIRGSKVFAHPYNFHLFPRDELSLGIPSYSFSCRISFLSSMAREGFDFNSCVYDGISYLSRVEEARVRVRGRNPRSWMRNVGSLESCSVADSIFKERIRSRVSQWRKSCQMRDDSVVQSLRKLFLGGEIYGSRPGLSVEICSEKQIQLVFEVVEQISDDLVPVLMPDKAVRIVLTNSEEDKKGLLAELQNVEDEQNFKFCGFRQVIDLISSSHKTIVAHNCLHEFTFVHEKFVGPLPATVSEFMYSLRFVFSNVIDLNHLLKEFGCLRKAKNLSSALSYLKRQYFLPVELEIPELCEDGNKSHGSNVLKLTFLFAKLNMLLKNDPDRTRCIEDYANIFSPSCLTLHEAGHGVEAGLWIGFTRRLSTDNLIFLWGFGCAVSAMELKDRLFQIHPVLSEKFDIHLVDRTCAVVVFESSGSAETLLRDIRSVDTVSGVLREMVVDGLKGAGYDAYKRVCQLGLWEGDLADSLEIALAENVEGLCSLSRTSRNEIDWKNEMMIDLNDF